MNDTTLDLDALFEQVAAERTARLVQQASPAAAPGTLAAPADVSELARSVAPRAGDAAAIAACADAHERPACARCPAEESADANAHMFQRLGQLTRVLHESLRQLGYDRKLASAASTMPDARMRLEYIATLTGRSAETVLEGVERAQALQLAVEQDASALDRRWQALFDGALSAEDFRALAEDTRAFLASTQQRSGDVREHLHQMMMAQDFHDLTGQVIKKIVAVAHEVEASLVDLLIANSAPEAPPPAGLSGPVVGTDATSDTVSNQAQVDQLLSSLGF